MNQTGKGAVKNDLVSKKQSGGGGADLIQRARLMYKNMYVEPAKKAPVTRNQQPVRQSSSNVPERPNSKLADVDVSENSTIDSAVARRKRSER